MKWRLIELKDPFVKLDISWGYRMQRKIFIFWINDNYIKTPEAFINVAKRREIEINKKNKIIQQIEIRPELKK